MRPSRRGLFGLFAGAVALPVVAKAGLLAPIAAPEVIEVTSSGIITEGRHVGALWPGIKEWYARNPPEAPDWDCIVFAEAP